MDMLTVIEYKDFFKNLSKMFALYICHNILSNTFKDFFYFTPKLRLVFLISISICFVQKLRCICKILLSLPLIL